MPAVALRLTIRGVVQGVGFRPFIYRIAVRSGLRGYVTNTPGSVTVHLEGDPEAIRRFRELFREELPPAARVARITEQRVAREGFSGFAIEKSEQSGTALSTIPPDIALCPACLRELSDPNDRRFGYPFINCTGCGPRFTIVGRLPYDRENTSMSVFPLCTRCRREYEDPGDRRFHAEPNACPDCGPSLSVATREGKPVATDDPVGCVSDALRSGKIVAVRGLGGFHLAADATNEEAVRKLRERKHREEKPFAVMVTDLAAARSLARLSKDDEAILSSPSAPVLLVETLGNARLAPSVAPGLANLGLFLPYTPLHRLIFDRLDLPLVMTSGNATDEPIATGNDEAIARLSGIADLFLLHNREIVQRSDDTVVRSIGGKIYPLRRARGFVPAPVLLKTGDVPENASKLEIPPNYLTIRNVPGVKKLCVAGLGGELKSTFCILKEGFAYLSQHLGDLDQIPVREFYKETFDFFRRFLDAELSAVCRDTHPAYFTTSFAENIGAGRILSLQHHKAHLYALLAESGFSGKAVGVSFDGTGYGEDGAIWGGEFFAIDGMEMKRAAAFDYFPLQGGDAAVREPWRTAVGFLHDTFGPAEAGRIAASRFPDIGPERIGLLVDAISKKVNVVPSSSCGRLFDAASALAGICRKASYEGQAAMLLEGCIRKGRGTGTYPYTIRDGAGRLGIDWKGLIAGVVSDASAGTPAPVIARKFHDTVAEIVLEVTVRLAEGTGAGHVLLSGGVFQNVYLLRKLLTGFRQRKLKTLIHREVPANDGGISLGQAYFAAQTISGG
ncbi:MAG: carbamoyltransferase HypF [Deltaproteobacteria bacterium]|nr:carbamoyltransferase HypF [Deltaproteobacteria bacterium]